MSLVHMSLNRQTEESVPMISIQDYKGQNYIFWRRSYRCISECSNRAASFPGSRGSGKGYSSVH